MLQKFSVSNFKNFRQNFELDLSKVKGYQFNERSIRNNLVNNAVIYGPNGVGKSNLAFAIFDIIEHLTDNNRNENAYRNYLNAYSEDKYATFRYEFLIQSKIVVYEYQKTDYKTIISEFFSIDGKELAQFDRTTASEAVFHLKGTETLKTEINNQELSILKYIKNNAALEDTEENGIFQTFFDFVDSMLYFRSLQQDRTYIGLDIGTRNILEDIIDKDGVKDFESFLNDAGVECKLTVAKKLDKDTIVFDFDGKQLSFNEVASTGTNALTLFYFWYLRIKEDNRVSFLFIDEFDAFYHFALSKLIVEKLRETGVQFILTTHNTSIISNDLLRPDCYFTMSKDHIRSMAKSTEKELREAHNIEKMYKAGAFHVE